MLLLLPRCPLGSNYQLDEPRRVLLRIDMVSNAQLAADIKIRWGRISSQLVDRRGLWRGSTSRRVEGLLGRFIAGAGLVHCPLSTRAI